MIMTKRRSSHSKKCRNCHKEGINAEEIIRERDSKQQRKYGKQNHRRVLQKNQTKKLINDL